MSSYDAIAGMYDALWLDWYLPAALPALERLLFDRIAPRAEILDVCCGSGHVTKELVRRGYKVTGVDQSAELITLARQQLPTAQFQVQNVCSLKLPILYDAALSTFDSLNHILTLEDLQAAFWHIRRALLPDALFVFDMNLDEAYSMDMKHWVVDIHDNSVGMVRGLYNMQTQRARTELMWFSRSTQNRDCWHQKHSVVEQQCYALEDILGALINAGFNNIKPYQALDVGVNADLALGRVFITATA